MNVPFIMQSVFIGDVTAATQRTPATSHAKITETPSLHTNKLSPPFVE